MVCQDVVFIPCPCREEFVKIRSRASWHSVVLAGNQLIVLQSRRRRLVCNSQCIYDGSAYDGRRHGDSQRVIPL